MNNEAQPTRIETDRNGWETLYAENQLTGEWERIWRLHRIHTPKEGTDGLRKLLLESVSVEGIDS